ncbi:MAG TPA: 2-C-methyl-D-erythritol 2,4-cyclodiphosphate synthase [Gemmatimonadaceae bacterium]|nr:2-C-methyl-D-erythritol 2,4-cyclodiphosphate synthase [Gemmatimonadaceae bacterium]
MSDSLSLRVGVGYDSHRFAPGGPLVLGGVRIESDVHLHGHSDGDAICHAVTDAILGAAAMGDIGAMFSDTDSDNAGRDSIEMLGLAVERVRRAGWRVGQLDVVVVAESPKLAPYRDHMRARVASATGIVAADVSIKGKTNELMGFVGRGEGVACIATATIVRA